MNKFAHIELEEKHLAEETLDYILKIQDTYLESTLYRKILDPREKYGDLHQHIDFLKERLSHLEFFVDYTDVTFENKMQGYSLYKYIDGIKIENSGVLTHMSNKIEEFSKEVFWANPVEEKNYQLLSDFNCFEEKIVSRTKMHQALVKAPFYNVEEWLQYYKNLLNLKFPDFSENIVSGKSIIKCRALKGEYYLGIETNYQSCKENFRKGYWREQIYKLIIFKKVNTRKIDRVVIFEKFVHPYFDPPAFGFEQYSIVKNMIKVSELEYSYTYLMEREFLDDDMVRLSMSEEFGEHLKRHAYFYYDLLYQTTKEFIKFVEVSFEE